MKKWRKKRANTTFLRTHPRFDLLAHGHSGSYWKVTSVFVVVCRSIPSLMIIYFNSPINLTVKCCYYHSCYYDHRNRFVFKSDKERYAGSPVQTKAKLKECHWWWFELRLESSRVFSMQIECWVDHVPIDWFWTGGSGTVNRMVSIFMYFGN